MKNPGVAFYDPNAEMNNYVAIENGNGHIQNPDHDLPNAAEKEVEILYSIIMGEDSIKSEDSTSDVESTPIPSPGVTVSTPPSPALNHSIQVSVQ